MMAIIPSNTLSTLSDVGTIARGKSKHRPRNDPALYNGKYPFVQTGDVKRAKLYVTDYTQTYNEAGLAQSKLWPEGTLCITIAANIAESAILGIPACFPDSVIGFTPHSQKSDVRFIKYCLDCYKIQLQSISHGTTQDNLSLQKLESLRFSIPSWSEQRKIAAVLTAYDDLIENNRQRIALLEKMAEEIYREWFVRLRFPGHEHTPIHKGVPEGWQRLSLPEIADITYGHPFKGSRFNSEGIGMPIVRIRNIPGGQTSDYTDEPASKKHVVKVGDLLIGMDGEFHMNRWPGPKALLVQRVCRIRAKSADHEGFLEYALRGPIKHYESILMGATVGHLGAKHLKSIYITLPKGKSCEAFAQLNELKNTKLNLHQQNQVLQQTRDLLLNRLISGKLRVDDLDIRLPPSMAEDPS